MTQAIRISCYLITTLGYARARSRSEKLKQAWLFTHLITTLGYARARSRSEKLNLPGCWCQRMLASFIVFLVDESINAALISWYGHAALNREILHKKHGGLAPVLNR